MIVKMKKAMLVVLKSERDKLLKSLQRYGILMIIKQEDNANDSDTVNEDAILIRNKKALTLMAKHRENKPFFGDVNIVNYEEFTNGNNQELELIEKIEVLDATISKSKQDIISFEEDKKLFTPWCNLDINLNEIQTTKYTDTHMGYIEVRKVELFEQKMKELGCVYQMFERSRLGQTVLFYNYKGDNKEIDDLLKNVSYVDAQLPKEEKTVMTLINERNDAIVKCNQVIEDCNNQIIELSNQITQLQVYNDKLLNQKKIKKVDYVATNETTYIEGWVRVDQVALLEKAINDVTDTYALEVVDPADNEVPPTYTKNSKIVSSFETITDMFSKPSYKELDPNTVMAVWYWIIFGMMVGDLGYGIALFVLTILFIKLAKPKGGTLKLAKILMYSSIPTMVWGIVYNSFFGAILFGTGSIFGDDSIFGTSSFMANIAFAPLDSAIKMLLVSVVAGALHIITGLVFKAYANIKERNILEMLSGQLSWICILVGIGAYAGGMFIDAIPYLDYIGIGLAVFGAALIVFLKGIKKKGIINKALSGVLGLYDITGYMSDLLSYTRIMALVMSSAAVAMVMNILAGMIQGSVIGFIFSIFIYIIGHAFNLVLGLLSAYVHDSRLQYIEFFGKFYEGGGYDFKPLAFEKRYVYEIKDELLIKNNK